MMVHPRTVTVSISWLGISETVFDLIFSWVNFLAGNFRDSPQPSISSAVTEEIDVLIDHSPHLSPLVVVVVVVVR